MLYRFHCHLRTHANLSHKAGSTCFIAFFFLCFTFFNYPLEARDESERASIAVQEIKKENSKAHKAEPRRGNSLVKAAALQKELIKGIDQTINYLHGLLRSFPKGSMQRLKVLEKLLNLHFEQARYVASDEQYKFEKTWDKWEAGGYKGAEPRVDNRYSRKHWESVSKSARGIMMEYPKNPNADRANYSDALAMQFLGRDREAVSSFQTLISRYPKSPIFFDAHFALGEYFFDNHRFNEALKYYLVTVRSPNATRKGWGLYKAAWAFYNLQKFRDSQNYWKMAIEQGERMGNSAGNIIKEESLRDIVFAFVELRQTDEAMSFFSRHKGEMFIPRFLRLMGNAYVEQGKYDEGIRTLKLLIRTQPLSLDALEAQLSIVGLNYDKGMYDQLWKDLENLIETYGPEDRWAHNNKEDDVQNAQTKIENMAIYYPKIIHKKGLDKKNSSQIMAAKTGYLLYLKKYPNSKFTVEVNEYIGDIDYYFKNYGAAGDTYLRIAKLGKDKAVIRDDKGQVKQNIHERTSKNMLDAFNKDAMPEIKSLLKVIPNFKSSSRPLSEKIKKFVVACNSYLNWYPNDSKLGKECNVYLGEIYFRSADKENARSALWKVITKYAHEKEGKAAVEAIIPMLKDDTKELVETAEKILKIDAYKNSKLADKLRDLIRGSEFENMNLEKNKLKRAKLLENYAQKNPTDKEIDKIWFNSANDYLASNEIAKALAGFQMIVSSFPHSPAYQDSLLLLAQINDKLLNFKQAVPYYQQYSHKYPNSKSTPGTLQRACELEIAQNFMNALSVCNPFISRYRKEAVFTVEKIIEIAFQSKTYEFMESVIKSHYLSKFSLSSNQKILAYHKILVTAQTENEKAIQKQNILNTARGGGFSGEAARYVAEIMFSRVESQYSKLMNMELKGGSVNALQNSIQNVSNAISSLEKSYAGVTSTKDAYWGIAVFHHLGEVYYRFAYMLENPPPITGAEPKAVKAELQGGAQEIKEKAKNHFILGINTAQKYNVFNDWVVRCREAQARAEGRKIEIKDVIQPSEYVGAYIYENMGEWLKNEK